jgi:hypothetical protein
MIKNLLSPETLTDACQIQETDPKLAADQVVIVGYDGD